MNTKKLAYLSLLLSILCCSWLYWGNDEAKIRRVITSKDWHSNFIIIIPPEAKGTIPELKSASKVRGRANIRYLSNGSYIKVTTVSFFTQNSEQLLDEIELSESGKWELSDSYLLIHPEEVRDVTPNKVRRTFSEKQVQMLVDLYTMNARESKRIDIINQNSILLSSLDHGSMVLSSNE